MTRASIDQQKNTPWFAKAGAASSIVPISRFVSDHIFALKGGGFGCLFSLTGLDEESLTDLELDSRIRAVEGALRGLPEGSCLYQYTRVLSGYDLPRQAHYGNTVTEVFATDRLSHLEKTASFRRIDLHWCLTLEPAKLKSIQQKPNENAYGTSRMLADLEKYAALIEGHLASAIFVDARGQIMEETLGNLSAFYAMFPGNQKFNVFPLWLSEDHHARLSSVFAPNLGHPHSDDLDSEYLNVFETRVGTPFFQDVYVDGVRVMLILGPTGTGKSVHGNQIIALEQKYGGFTYIFDIGGSYESVVELAARVKLNSSARVTMAKRDRTSTKRCMARSRCPLIHKGGCVSVRKCGLDHYIRR